MTEANLLRELLKAHISLDNNRFYTAAVALVAYHANLGHIAMAHELRTLMDSTISEPVNPVPAELLGPIFPKVKLEDLAVEDGTRARIERIVLEQRKRDDLHTYGLAPRRTMLLIGPSGSGKTYTASVLAGELHLPLFVAKTECFIDHGASVLRSVLSRLPDRGVYLFEDLDEIAFAYPMAAAQVIATYASHTDSVLVFTSRRELPIDLSLVFDDVIQYHPPSKWVAMQVIGRNLNEPIDDSDHIGNVVCDRKLSFGDLVKACKTAKKDALLHNTKVLEIELFLRAIEL